MKIINRKYHYCPPNTVCKNCGDHHRTYLCLETAQLVKSQATKPEWGIMNVQSCSALMEQDKLTPVPPISRTAELQISPILIVDLVRKGESGSSFKTRTLLDTGSSTSWCHEDLLSHVEYKDLGSTIMTVQVFEGTIKKKYRYVELYYTVNDKKGSLKCFVTDQYAWFNEVAGLTTYAAQQLENHYIIDPTQPCDHDFGKKAVALILGPFASMKLRNKN